MGATDRLVFLGDYVDRGPDSAKVIEFLIRESKNRNCVFLKGNHELMMLSARHDLSYRWSWVQSGGDQTWDSYSREYGHEGLDGVPESHWDFLASGLPWFETGTHVFVHAEIQSDLELAEQPDYLLYWGSFDSIAPLNSRKIVVCGHTSQRDGIPRHNGHAICIDTWDHGRGWLTCLDVSAGKYYQVNHHGETRTAWLDPKT